MTTKAKSVTPILSVVIPTYNIEGYIAECLDSVLAQNIAGLEIIVVDDGSTDRTLEIVEEYASRSGCMSVLYLDHAGNGRARNIGVSQARGEFLTFADGDDRVPAGSYNKMLARLRESGSDFVCGAYERLEGTRRFMIDSCRVSNGQDKRNATFETSPESLYNPFLWCKMYRRAFWNDSVAPIPEDGNYEDQEPTARALVAATSFEVMTDVVYEWRQRMDGTSLTQAKHELADLERRLAVTERIRREIKTEHPELLSYWSAKLLRDDLFHFYQHIPQTEDAYLITLSEAVTRARADVSNEDFMGLPYRHRVMADVVGRGCRADVESVLLAAQRFGWAHPLRRESNGVFRWVPPFSRQLSAPLDDTVTAASAGDVQIGTQLDSIDWLADGSAVINLGVWITGVGSLDAEEIEAHLISPEGKKMRLGVVDCSRSPREGVFPDQALVEYVPQLVSITVPAPDLRTHTHGTECRFRVAAPRWSASEVGVSHRAKTSFHHPFGNLGPGARWVARKLDGELALRFESPAAHARSIETSNRIVRLEAMWRNGAPVERGILESSRGDVVELRCTAGSRNQLVGLLPAPSAKQPLTEGVRWRVYATSRSGKKSAIAIEGNLDERGSGEWAIDSSSWGYLEFDQRRWRATVSDVALEDGGKTLLVRGVAGPSHLESGAILAAAGSVVLKSRSLLRDLGPNGEWEARIPLVTDGVPAATGSYMLKWHAPWHTENSGYALECGRGSVPPQHPVDLYSEYHRVRFEFDPGRRARVDIRQPYRVEERGRFAQRRLQLNTRRGPIERSVLVECFNGKSYGDSIAPIVHEMRLADPEVPIFAAVTRGGIALPDGVEPVLVHSQAWYQAASTSRVIITNNNMPHYFIKREGQRLTQVWHGTPLKRLLHDMPRSSRRLDYWELMVREVPTWDRLIAQSEEAARYLRSGFQFEGEVNVVGYPRNDVLAGDAEAVIRNSVRASLGIPVDARVLLYAPTWRDNARGRDGRVRASELFRSADALAALGDEWWVVERAHHVAASGRSRKSGRVIDGTEWGAISELYLACDVLVTDYSSAMFDFAITGKPIVYLAPDIDEYESSVRGFYFDFRSSAPGPIVYSTAGVVDVLSELAWTGQAYASRYAEWVERFCYRDDGCAGTRVAQMVLGDLG